MQDAFLIDGGHPIGGAITPAGNKNEALPLLAAALLAPGRTLIENLPRIHDVETQLELLRQLGVGVELADAHTVALDASGLRSDEPEFTLASQIRGSFLLAAPLLARRGRTVLPRPGGDKIGRRRIDTHLAVLEQLGARVEVRADRYELTLHGRFKGAEVFLDEASVMATENAVMAAALADGTSQILNAASEPHVQGLCHALCAMGATITGIGSNVLEVTGTSAPRPVRHRLSPDHIEIGSFIAVAAMTRGTLAIRDVVPQHLRMVRLVFSRLGVETRMEGRTLVVPGEQTLAVQSDVDGAIPKVDDAPWPGFPADLTPLVLVLATQCHGTVRVHEKMFESRLFFVDRLIAMGARVVLCDPHRALVSGPTRLRGAEIASPDIRSGMAMIAAALSATGRSVIHRAHQVDRGYERIDERLRSLDARITRAQE